MEADVSGTLAITFRKTLVIRSMPSVLVAEETRHWKLYPMKTFGSACVSSIPYDYHCHIYLWTGGNGTRKVMWYTCGSTSMFYYSS